jgi:hypothetical protein
MAKSFTFEIQGIKRIEQVLKTMPVEVQAEINEEIEETARTIVKKAKQRAPKYDGQLQQAIGYGWLIDKTGFEVFAAKNYAAFVEFGTGGKVEVPAELRTYAAKFKKSGEGTHDEFVDAMTRWVRKKGIAATQVRQIKSGKNKGKFKKAGKLAQGIYERELAKFLVFLILKNGLKARPFLFNSYFEERPKLVNKIKNVLKLK